MNKTKPEQTKKKKLNQTSTPKIKARPNRKLVNLMGLKIFIDL